MPRRISRLPKKSVSVKSVRMMREPFNFRQIEVGSFEQMYKNAKDYKEEMEVRNMYRRFESGRFAKMADAVHIFMSALDVDEVEKFKKTFPNMTKIANEYGVIEELRKF